MAYQHAIGRLSVLSRHLSSSDIEASDIQRQHTKADEEVRPAPGGGHGTLTIIDHRTGKKYTVSACLCDPTCPGPRVFPIILHMYDGSSMAGGHKSECCLISAD
eukprot:GHRR01034952.1.p1 GENE.GHRR01034952.1~~GHRR01034952.1.p1  ORF type:complete len:104 (-),score=10.46 GHRR01034952.1:476-787(-)